MTINQRYEYLHHIVEDCIGQPIDNFNQHKDYRNVIIKILRDDGYSLQQIGELFNLHHATVIYSLKLAYDGIYDSYDKHLKECYEEVKLRLNPLCIVTTREKLKNWIKDIPKEYQIHLLKTLETSLIR